MNPQPSTLKQTRIPTGLAVQPDARGAFPASDQRRPGGWGSQTPGFGNWFGHKRVRAVMQL